MIVIEKKTAYVSALKHGNCLAVSQVLHKSRVDIPLSYYKAIVGMKINASMPLIFEKNINALYLSFERKKKRFFCSYCGFFCFLNSAFGKENVNETYCRCKL